MIVTMNEEALVQFDNLPTKIQARINNIIERLKNWPNVSGAKPLKYPLSGQYRIRTGDYRVQFIVGKSEIIVVRVGHRDGFYEENMPKKKAKALAARYDAVYLTRWMIGNRIQKGRLKRHLSVRALAEAVGVTSAKINQLERGKSTVSVKLIDRISDILDVA